MAEIPRFLSLRMSGNPHSGSKVWKPPDREISEPGEIRGKVIPHRDFQPAPAFHDWKNRCNLRSCQWTAECIQFFRPSAIERMEFAASLVLL